MELLDGRYELTGLLGRGGMAEVHRAHDRLLDRPVAVKVLLDPVAGEADPARHRFAAEAQLLAELHHPAVVTLLDVGSAAGRPYFVMELVDGGTLSERLTGEPLDPVLTASIGSQVAEALAHAHAHDVVHRDVKPGNVLLGTDGRARLADFGIARILGESVGVTGTGTTVGTVAYLAPEQVRGERVTPAADVYALGLMLLEAVTGERAYPGTSTEAALARLHRNPTIPVSLPHGWPRLLAAMTSTDPAERPTAAEAATILRGLAAGEVIVLPAAVSEPSTVETPRTQSVPVAATVRPVPRYRLVAAAAVAVGVAVGGGALFTPDAAVSDEKPSAPVRSVAPGPAAPAPTVSPVGNRSAPAPTSDAGSREPERSSGAEGRTRQRTRSGDHHDADRAKGKTHAPGQVRKPGKKSAGKGPGGGRPEHSRGQGGPGRGGGPGRR